MDIYLMGSLAALSLGPLASNLLGGRVGAERIANSLWGEWHQQLLAEQNTRRPDLSNLAKMAANMGNYWSALVDAE